MLYSLKYSHMLKTNSFKLFAISFVMLFMELFLIRWVSTEIRIFAYVANLAILSCLLGIGIGCYLSNKKHNILFSIAALAAIVVCVDAQSFRNITEMLSGFTDSVIWYESVKTEKLLPAIQGAILTSIMFVTILVSFIPIGQILAKLMESHKNIIKGYSVNIVGSLAGVWGFNLFSFASLDPWVGFAVIIALLLIFSEKQKFTVLAGLAALFLMAVVSNVIRTDTFKTIWSPYQKLDLCNNAFRGIQNGYCLKVNNVGYMSLIDLSDDFIAKHPESYNPIMRRYMCHYELPYLFTDKRDDSLIIGAGGGNDVAGALRSGVRKIDAVEIDPKIYEIGKKYHPEKPYQDDRVNLIVNDARAFLKRADKKYDVISFGLLDSHVLSSNYNNIRPDHYVYTLESIEETKRLLKDDGILTVIFAAHRPWIINRIYGIIKKVYGEVPYVFFIHSSNEGYGWGGVMFVTGKNTPKIKKYFESNRILKTLVEKNRQVCNDNVILTTDDWPYLYVEKPSLPRMHILIIISLVIILFMVKRFLMISERRGIDFHFFLLGAAFVLLEFQNISKGALLFGSTWIVNSYIISAILLLILASNVFVYYIKPKAIMPYYLALFISIVVLYVLPLDIFNNFGVWVKSLIGVMVLNIPVFFAGVIFITSFKRAEEKNIALGSNILGSVAGGILEMMSFLIGIKALLLVLLITYILSLLAYKKNIPSTI